MPPIPTADADMVRELDMAGQAAEALARAKKLAESSGGTEQDKEQRREQLVQEMLGGSTREAETFINETWKKFGESRR